MDYRLIIFTSFFLFSFFGGPQLAAKVVETATIEAIESEICEGAILFFDVDDTLIARQTMLGSSPWWHYARSLIKEEAADERIAFSVLMPLLFEASYRMPVRPVEELTGNMIQRLQQIGIECFGLTTRSPAFPWALQFDLMTYEELKTFGIDFDQPYAASYQHLPDYKYGIIFTSHQLKAPFLKKFLKESGKKPSKVIFVDDDMKEVMNIEDALKDLKIPTVCFRYAKMDAIHSAFDPLTANIQFESYLEHKKMLTDEEAGALAEKRQGSDPHYYLRYLLLKLAKP